MLTGTSAVARQNSVEISNDTRPGSIFPTVATLLVGSVWIPATVMAVLLLLKVESWWTPSLVLSLGLLAAFAYLLLKPYPRELALRILVILLGAVLVAAIACIFLYDTMHDSRGYHADAILALLHNINPLYQHIPAIRPLNANHFPKATWYFAALVIHWVGNYQVGKIYNFLLMFACFAYAKYFFQQKRISSGYSTVLAAVVAVSAIAGSQLFTFYVDGALGALLIMAILTAVNIVFSPARYDRWLFFLSSSLAIAIKFTSLFYVAVVLLGLMATRILLQRTREAADFRRKIRGDVILAAAVYLCGVLVLGYDPYITNVQRGFDPLYPIVVRGHVDNVVAEITPPALAARSDNRLGQFLISVFGTSQTFEEPQVRLKIPFTVRKKELISMGSPDTEIAGWGVFFSGVLLASLILFLITKGWNDNIPIILAVALVLITTVMNPASWWARYSPQFAVVPVLLLATVLTRHRERSIHIAAQTVCVFLVLNSLIPVLGGAGAAYVRSRHLNHLLAAIRTTSGPGEYWAYRDPKSHEHYEQFSGYQGIRICGQVEPPREPLPDGGFPLTVNVRNQTEVTLFKGSCAAGPPLSGSRPTDLR